MDIFDKIVPAEKQEKQENQVDNILQNPNSPKKSYFQVLLDEDGRNPDYTLTPMKKFISKPRLKKQLAEHIKILNTPYDDMDFFYDIKMSIHKKLDLTKVRVSENKQTFNMMEYLVYSLPTAKNKIGLYMKYLFANEPRFKDKEIVDRCMKLLVKNTGYQARETSRKAGNEFIKVYKLLIDNGARSRDYVGSLFELTGELAIKSPDFFELLLYENDETINRKLLNWFYICPNPQDYYPLLQKYGLEININDAIVKLMHPEYTSTVKYLLEKGVITEKNLTEEKIKFAFARKDMQNPLIIKKAITSASEILNSKAEQVATEKTAKVTTKQSLKASTEIDKLFEQAIKNTDENTK